MALIPYNRFNGEIPQARPHLLPQGNAQEAINCDFGSGSLQPLKGGFVLGAMANTPVRGIYTEDGINFFTWATTTYAFRSPVIDDAYRRVYFLQPGGSFNVTTSLQAAYNGPTPLAANTFKAGVPRPTVAPGLALVDRSTLRDHATAITSAQAWWEYTGKSYGKATVNLTQVTAWRSFTFTAPTKPTDTPAEAVLVVSFKIRDGTTDLVSVTVREGTPARSNGLPGGVEVSLSTSGTTGTLTLSWGVVETRAYAYTYYNTWQEESAPSPAALIDVTYLQDVKVTVSAGTFTGYRPFLGYRIYRTYGSSTAYVETTVSGAFPTYTDGTGGTASVGKALESSGWTPPPATLRGLELMPNGWFAGYVDNTLWMSEPYRPHAWPYNMTFPSAIRGVKAGTQSLVVTTLDGVYVVSGAFPASAQQIKLNLPQGGISQNSMTGVDGAVCYASPDGLVMVQGTSATMAMSQKLFRREEWQRDYGTALDNGDLYLAYHDGCLIGTSKSMNKGFSIRFDEAGGAYTRIDQGYDAMFFLPVADSLYYSIGNVVYQFRGGSDMTMSWWSKDWIFQSHTTFGAGFVRTEGPVTMTLYAGGSQVYQITLGGTGHFRLPAMVRSLRWSFKLSGQFEVQEFYLGRTMGELKSV